MTESVKRTRLGTIEEYLGQMVSHLPELDNDQSEIGRIWSALKEEVHGLAEDIQQQDRVLDTTTAIAEVTDTISRPEHLRPNLVEIVQQHFAGTPVALYLLDATGQQAERKAQTEPSLPIELAPEKPKIDESTPIGRAILRQQPTLFPADKVGIGLALPLLSRGDALGCILIHRVDPLHPDNLTALQTLAAQVANALQTTRLFSTIDEQLEQLATLYHISLQVGSHLNINLQLHNHNLDFDALLDNLAHLSLQLTGAEASQVYLIDPDRDQITGWSATTLIPNKSVVKRDKGQISGLEQHVLQTKQPVLGNQWSQHALGEHFPTKAIMDEEIKALMHVPIVLRGRAIGTMEVQHFDEANPFDDNDLHILSLLASQAAIAIENTHLFNQAENNSRFLKTILEHIPDPIFIKDRQHTWVEMNSANLAVVGRPTEDVIGKTDHDFFAKELADEFYRRDDQVFTKNETLTFEDKTTWADGEAHIAYTRLIPIPDNNGQPQYLLGISQDITERRAREAERERLLNEMAMMYNGSQTIASALSERQVFAALFKQIRLQNPSQITAYYYKSVDDEPIWVELKARWSQQTGWTRRTGDRLYLPDSPEANCLTVNQSTYLEDVATDSRLSDDERESFRQRGAVSTALLPLVTTGQNIGIILIDFAEPFEFTNTVKQFWQAMVDQASVLLSNRQLLQEVTYRAVQIETAADVARTASSILGVNQLLNSAVKLIRDRFELYYVGVFLVDDEKEWAILKAGTGEPGRIQIANEHRLEIGGESMIGQCLANLKARIALDVGREAVHFQNPHLPHTSSEMALPLIYRNEAIGALTVQSREQVAFSHTDIIFLQTMADQLANAIENALLFEKAQLEITERKRIEQEILNRHKELAAINRVAAAVSTTLDLQDMLRAAAREIVLIFNARRSGITLINDEQTNLEVIASYSQHKNDSTEGLIIPIEPGDSAFEVIKKGQPFAVSKPYSPSNELSTPDVKEMFRILETEAIMIVPLIVRNEVVGTIGVDLDEVDRDFTTAELQLAETIASQIASSIENANLFEKTQIALAEQKRVETVLKESENRYRNLYDTSPIAYLSTDTQGVIYMSNASTTDLLGYNQDELIGHSIFDLYADTPLGKPKAERFHQRLIEGDIVQGEEVEMTRASGRVISTSLRLRPIQDDKDQIVGQQIAIEDITERKRAEDTIRDSEERYRLLLTSSPDPIVMYDPEGNITYINDAFSQTFGWSIKDILGQPLNFIPQDSQAETEDAFQRMLRHETVLYETKRLTKTNQVLDMLISGASIKNKSGDITGLVSILRDITERKQTETALQTTFKRTQSLHHISNTLVAHSDQDTIFEIVLQEYLNLLGLQRGSLILLDKQDVIHEVSAFYADGQKEIPSFNFLADQDQIADYLRKNTEPLVIENVKEHPLTAGYQYSQDDIEAVLFTPLTVKDNVIGIIGVATSDPNYQFSDQDLEVSELLADQLTIWLENRRLLQETQRRSSLLEIGAEVSRVASSILNEDELIDKSVNLIRDQFGLYYVGLFLIDPANEWAVLRAGTGEPGRRQLAKNHRLQIGGDSMIGWSVSNREARIALDVGQEAVHFENPDLPETRSEMALPLISRDEVIGALTVQSEQREAFSQEDITLLQIMADQVANAILNARLFEESQQAQQEAEERLHETIALQQLSQALSGTLQVDEILDIFFRACTRVIGFEYVILAQIDLNEHTVSSINNVGISELKLHQQKMLLETSLAIEVMQEGQTQIITGWDERLQNHLYEVKQANTWTRLITPLMLRQKPIGIVEAGFKNQSQVLEDSQIGLLRAFVDQTALALDNAWRYQESQRTARREALIKEITTRVRASTDIDTILQTTVREIRAATSSQKAYINLLPPINGHDKHDQKRSDQ